MPAPSLGLRLCLLFLSTVTLISAETFSYIVLQESPMDSLVRISSDGKNRFNIANGVGGEYLTIDRNGDYIVSARHRLSRVSKLGQVTVIATPPDGSEWGAVAVDASNAIYIADAAKAFVWKIDPGPGGTSPVLFSHQSRFQDPRDADPPQLRATSRSGMAFCANGDLLLIRDGTPFPALVRIHLDGGAEKLPMSGSVVVPADRKHPWDYSTLSQVIPHATRAVGSHSLTLFPDGTLAFLDKPYARSIYRITPDNLVERMAEIPLEDESMRFIPPAGLYGMSRTPSGSDLIVVAGDALILWNSKSGLSSILANLDFGRAVAVESAR